MFIPTPVQELHLPLTQKLEVTPIAPVSAVPGVPEDAQSLDSRVALQWTQPAFAGAEGQAGRSVLAKLATPLPEALLQAPKTAVPVFEPQGADPDAMGNVHPLLAQGLSTWLNGVLAKSSGNANLADLSMLMAKVVEQSSKNSVVNTASDKAANATGLASTSAQVIPAQASASTPASMVLGQLKNIYQALAGSDVFAAQRLNEAWMPRRVVTHNKTASEASQNSALSEFQQLAQPIQEPSQAQLTQWVAALEPDSDAAEQAARMLSQGNMVWQAELVPGLPMRIVREDAWRNNPQQAGQLEKGAMLKVEVTLPHLGTLRILGSQWGQDISLQVLHGTPERNGKVNWSMLAPDLLQELKTQGVTDVRVVPLPEEVARTETSAESSDLPQEKPNV
jgi:hypothetical protein